MGRGVRWLALIVAVVAAVLAFRTCADDEGATPPGADDGGPEAATEPATHATGPQRQRDRAKPATAVDETAPATNGASADPGVPAARTARFTAIVLRKEDGVPIEGARVLTSDGAGHREIATDARGRAEFEVVPGGVDFGVVAVGRAREQGHLEATAEGVAREFLLEPGAQAAGRVTDARTGLPVADALVTVRIGGFDGLSTYHWAGDWEVGHVTTGPDGRFSIEGMAPGTVFTLRAEAAGYAAAERPATPYAVGRCACDIALAPGRTIRGRVADSGGKPLAGLSVRCLPAWKRPVQAGPFGDWTVSMPSGADGGFRFAGLDADGTYMLEAWADEGGCAVVALTAAPGTDDVVLRFEPTATLLVRAVVHGAGVPGSSAWVRRLSAPAGDFDFTSVAADGKEVLVLSPGRYRVSLDSPTCDPPPSADVELAPGQTVTCEIPVGGLAFEGRVVNGEPATYGDAEVTLRQAGGEHRVFETTTDRRGAFIIGGLSAGRYSLRIEHDGASTVTEEIDIPSEPREWTLVPAPVARMDMPPSATGRDLLVVLDRAAAKDDEDSVGGWRLQEQSTSASPYDPADPVTFTIETPGRVRIRVIAEGFVTAHAEAVAPRTGEFRVAVPELVAGVVLEGRVVDPDGAPVPSAGVDVVDRGNPELRAIADAEGRFRTPAVPPGEVRLHVQPRGRFLPATLTVTASANASAPVTLTVHRGGVVIFVLTDAHGAAVTGRDLDVTDERGEPSAWAVRTDHRGRAQARLNPGKHRVAGKDVEPATVTVAEDGEQTVRLTAR